MDNDQIRYVDLTIDFNHEGDQWIAECRELGTVAQEDTFEEAEEAIRECIKLHLNALEGIAERSNFFRKHGIRMRKKQQPGKESQLRAPLGQIACRIEEPVAI